MVSWIDLGIYKGEMGGSPSNFFRVQNFGLWFCHAFWDPHFKTLFGFSNFPNFGRLFFGCAL